MTDDLRLPTFADVVAAQARITPHVHHTPVFTSRILDELVGTHVLLKAESLQRVGAFKARGATNVVLSLSATEARHGVAAHSSGNHAAALALAASIRGIPAHLVMPAIAPQAKKDAVRSYGGHIYEFGPTMAERVAALDAVLAETGAHQVHPFDDVRVIAGQGTAALELLQDHPDIGLVIVPISGGGLTMGTAIAMHGLDPGLAVWAAEPAGADDAYRSLESGHLVTDYGHTIADGLRAHLSPRTFAGLQQERVQIVRVTDDEIIDAMRLLFTRTKLVVEPAGACSLAGLIALARQGVRLPATVAVILSGGNVDLDHLPFA